MHFGECCTWSYCEWEVTEDIVMAESMVLVQHEVGEEEVNLPYQGLGARIFSKV
jgi:hypothetical protein